MTISFTTLGTSALGFTIALAWNDAISKFIGSLFPAKSEKATARATLLYALVITVLVVCVVAVINHTRRALHRYRGGDADGGGQCPRAEGMRGQPPPRDCADCRGCDHCYPQPIVRFWEPRP
jgi:hypothetical protein